MNFVNCTAHCHWSNCRCARSVTSPRLLVSPRPAGVWKTQQSIAGSLLPASNSTSGSGHVTTPVGGGSSALAHYQNWLGGSGGGGADSPACRGGGILGRRRVGGRVGRSTVTFLSPVRDGRPIGGITAALDDRPYAATLKADRNATAPMTVTTAAASLPRRRRDVWPLSTGGGCPQCSPPRTLARSVSAGSRAGDAGGETTCGGRCRADPSAPSCVTDGRLRGATSGGESWPTCKATPSEWPLNSDSCTNICARLLSAEDTPV